MFERYTPFGRAVKILQIETGVKTGALARACGCSPSFFYQTLAGEKRPPAAFLDRLVDAMALDATDAAFLRNALEATPGAVEIAADTPLRAAVANAFKTAMPEMDETLLRKLLVLIRGDGPIDDDRLRRLLDRSEKGGRDAA